MKLPTQPIPTFDSWWELNNRSLPVHDPYELARAVAERLTQPSAPQSEAASGRWIAVSPEGMPVDENPVLGLWLDCAGSHESCVCKDGVWWDEHGAGLFAPDYWMPLPAPPTASQDAQSNGQEGGAL